MNMAIHKLDLGEFDEIDYYLIAIHTSLEDYRLAFFINQKLPCQHDMPQYYNSVCTYLGQGSVA